jgi:ribonuclease D
MLKFCSEESGLAEKLIADTDDLRSVLEGKKDDLKLFKGWRNDVFGKNVLSLLDGKIAFSIKKGEIKKLIL